MTPRRLSVALHVLVHLAHRRDERRTSEELARCARTNPVVIRRTLAGLRDAGLVRSFPGPGGGWTLARSPDDISLGEVCRAIGERVVPSLEAGPAAGCRVQGAVVDVLDGVLREAESALLERLDGVTLARVATGPLPHARGGIHGR